MGDLGLELSRLPADAAVGTVLALRGGAGKPDDNGMPVPAPSTTLGDVKAATKRGFPGARLRRGLFWRYLLTWQSR